MPGGGYFYTRHPWLGLGDAFWEVIILFILVASLIGVLSGEKESIGVLVLALGLLAVEKIVSIYHANRFIDEYIPRESRIKLIEPTGVPEPVSPA